MTTPAKKPHRDARQIAQDQLALTQRKLERNQAAQANLRRLLAETEARGGELERLAQHQLSHPALADNPA